MTRAAAIFEKLLPDEERARGVDDSALDTHYQMLLEAYEQAGNLERARQTCERVLHNLESRPSPYREPYRQWLDRYAQVLSRSRHQAEAAAVQKRINSLQVGVHDKAH